MCNHYRNDIRKLGLSREIYGFGEFSELPLDIYPNRLAPVIVLEDGAPIWRVMRCGFPKFVHGRRRLSSPRLGNWRRFAIGIGYDLCNDRPEREMDEYSACLI